MFGRSALFTEELSPSTAEMSRALTHIAKGKLKANRDMLGPYIFSNNTSRGTP